MLGLVVADMLLKQFPDAREGEIAPRFNALVEARTCSEIGLQMELDQYMRADSALRSGARKAGGNYLADAVEALVAAIYLDGGIDAARAFVLRYWEPLSLKVVEKPVNPKGELQEWIAKSSDTRPAYVIERPRRSRPPARLHRFPAGEGLRARQGKRQFAPRGRGGGGSRLPGAGRRVDRREGSQFDGRTKARKTHSGFVALIGAPNAGKSTLVNQLVGAKVSIVTHKVQTTRAIVRGIATHDNAQIVFVDTPGIFKPRRRLDTAMVTTAWGGAKDADIVLVLIDAERGIKGDADTLLDKVATATQPKVLILNKVDRVKPETLLDARRRRRTSGWNSSAPSWSPR